MSTDTLRVEVFPGGFNLPLWAGQANGFFEREGLTVVVSQTRSSVDQMSNLIAGRQDIALTAMDNVIAYRDGAGAVELPGADQIFAFMGSDNGFLSLVVQDSVRSNEDLRGRTLSVDALTTGFAFVLRAMLRAGGLADGDYELANAGGVTQRWERLIAGDHAGTLVLTPFDLLADGVGLRVLQRAQDVIPRYQGVVGAARRDWAAAHADRLTRFIAGYRRALDWLFAPENRARAGDLLRENTGAMPDWVVSRTLDIFLSAEGGFFSDADLDLPGIEATFDLRRRFGSGPALPFDLDRYVDRSFHAAIR